MLAGGGVLEQAGAAIAAVEYSLSWIGKAAKAAKRSDRICLSRFPLSNLEAGRQNVHQNVDKLRAYCAISIVNSDLWMRATDGIVAHAVLLPLSLLRERYPGMLLSWVVH